MKAQSVSSQWINKQIKLKMNRRFNIFKTAIETKEREQLGRLQKKLRNEITSDISLFKRKFDEAKTTSEFTFQSN